MELPTKFETDADMTNPISNLHGGMTAAIFDHGLGSIGVCYANGAFTPTMSLNIEHLRPAPVGGKLYVHVVVTKPGRSLSHVRGELLESPDSRNPYVTAAAIYAVHRKEKI